MVTTHPEAPHELTHAPAMPYVSGESPTHPLDLHVAPSTPQYYPLDLVRSEDSNPHLSNATVIQTTHCGELGHETPIGQPYTDLDRVVEVHIPEMPRGDPNRPSPIPSYHPYHHSKLGFIYGGKYL